jgi:hypothetical protein
MTKRSTPYEPRETTTAVQPVKSERHSNVTDRQRLGGRPKGIPNKINLDTRKAIIEALTQLGNELDQGNRQGVISFIKAACRENLTNGIKLLTAITPKMLDVDIQKTTTIKYRTIEELDEDWARRGLPPLKEIFAVDFKGTPVPSIDNEPVLDGELISPRRAPKD